MSSAHSPTPELVFKIAHAKVLTELLPPTEVASAPTGLVTESFGPMQIALQDAHVTGKLNTSTPYTITAGTPHGFHAQEMHFISHENGVLLFRRAVPKA